FAIEQLQCIPFRRIMAGRDDNGTVGLVFKYGHGYRRRGGYAHLNHIAAYRLQRGRYDVLAYLTGYAGVAAHDDCTILGPASKSGRKTGEVFRSQVGSKDAPDARDGNH